MKCVKSTSGFPYEGPAPLEAISNGIIFLNPRFNPPHGRANKEFFSSKPTSRAVSVSFCLYFLAFLIGNTKNNRECLEALVFQ
ncbi:unnamed protein product [Trichobilharzia regenti]|nr:unnamed protein product [Trichobilharzia regenti]